MANPHKGEIEYIFTTFADNGERVEKYYTLKLNNEGKSAAEEFLGVQGQALAQMIDQGMGSRLRAALFFGATRKFHARDFPRIQPHVFEFLDELDDAVQAVEQEEGIDMMRELDSSLLAAFMRTDKKRIKNLLSGIPPDEDEDTDSDDTDAAEPEKPTPAAKSRKKPKEEKDENAA